MQVAKQYFNLVRWHNPAGSHLLFLPGAWSISMASFSSGVPLIDTLWYTGLFGVGSVVMRGAGCIINDLWDQKLDRLVERTKLRPLAAGNISNKTAVAFLGLNLSLGLGILTQLNYYSIILGACSLPLVIAYPLMKRITFWPQAFLGITFNWGALVGYSAITGHVDPAVVMPLYLGCINWTLFYDTVYALQDKNDDIKVGIKSTAIKFGQNLKYYLAFFGIGTVSFLGLAGYYNRQTWIYYSGLVASASHLFLQFSKVRINDRNMAGKIFTSSVKTGWIFYAGVILDLLAMKCRQIFDYKHQNDEN